MIDIDHYGNGSGSGSASTFGIDIQNFPQARQALVVHQYSKMREAVRIDNTDSNASLYINNTQNTNINPGHTGQGSAFMKFHPYNMANFLDFAYLMDDLTWRNDTEKTWGFQATAGGAPVLVIKDPTGKVVAAIRQDGSIDSVQLAALETLSRDTGWRESTALVEEAGWTVRGGQLLLRRVGIDVEVRTHGLSLGTSVRAPFTIATLPQGFRPQFTTTDTTSVWDRPDAAVTWRAQTDAALRVRALKAGATMSGSLRFTTIDPLPR